MPVLSNPRHERFAQALAQGKSADEAYQIAGFKPNRGNASTLKAQQSILDRVAELLAVDPQEVAISKKWVMDMLRDNALVCSGKKPFIVKEVNEDGVEVERVQYARNPSAANTALELLGREFGMFIERSEVGAPGDFDRLNDDELRKVILQEAEELGVSADVETRH